jgi:hypothetical protein
MSEVFCGAAVRLWGDTAQDAVYRAIQAQNQPMWRALWSQCVAANRRSSSSDKEVGEGHGGTPVTEASAKADAAVIVAGFVLSVPWRDDGKASSETDLHHTSPVDEASSKSQVGPSASALQSATRRYLCVSLGSGSRCLGVREGREKTAEVALQRSLELRDGHAEVMARRGLVAFLLDLAETGARMPAEDALTTLPFLKPVHVTQEGANAKAGWDLQDGVCVHLVCSRWMCGSLAAVAGGTARSGHLLLRAGCGCWASRATQEEVRGIEAETGQVGPASASPQPVVYLQGHVIAAHYSSIDGAATYARCSRLKPGRGRPNLTMSCTDKVWRWSVFGLQGRRRASLFPTPLRLSSVHILRGAASLPASSSAAGMRDNYEALQKARELLQWRTRSWWPTLPAAELARVTPKFVLFEAPSATNGRTPFLASTSSSSAPPTAAETATGDSSYSRCRWLAVHTAPATASPLSTVSRKRARMAAATGEEEEGEESDGDDTSMRRVVCCDWRTDGRAADSGGGGGGSANTLVLNTKAGLPQGMTARGLAQRALKDGVDGVDGGLPVARAYGGKSVMHGRRAAEQEAVNALWWRCPLSRSWMSHRLDRALAALGASPIVAALSASSAFDSSRMTASGVAFLDTVALLRVQEVAHRQHVQSRSDGSDEVIFLWATRAGGGEDEPMT